MSRIVDSVTMFATDVVLAMPGMPGQNMTPSAPGDFGQKIDGGLNFAMFLGIAVAIVGVIVAGASLVISRREGSSEEATSTALRIGIGSMVIGSATAIVSAFL